MRRHSALGPHADLVQVLVIINLDLIVSEHQTLSGPVPNLFTIVVMGFYREVFDFFLPSFSLQYTRFKNKNFR
jgi:hypothetical protein